MSKTPTTFAELYAPFWQDLHHLVLDHPGLSCPLLLDFPDGYWSQSTRLFVVGQQTNSWRNELRQGMSIELLMAGYKWFLDSDYHSPFWDAVRAIEGHLGIERGQLLWGNLNKVDQDRGRPAPDVESALCRVFPVLEHELRLAEPDLVVFFTGPYYDGLIARHLPGVRIDPIPGFGNGLRRLHHSTLPVSSFLTYHPKYLRLSKKWEPVLTRITEIYRTDRK